MSIENYLNDADSITRDNANHNPSFSGLQAYVASEILKEDFLSKLEEIDVKLFKSGAIHIHNCSEGGRIFYCHGGSLLNLLLLGIKCGDITSKPPRHADTAIDHIVNYLMMITQENSGAVALSDFNTLLAPFIRKDRMGYAAVKQNIQRLMFNLGFPSRKAFQNPFSNLTFNLRCPKYFADMPAIIGGKEQDSTYADYQQESDLILDAFSEIQSEGDGSGRPFTFPIGTLNLVKNADYGSETWKKILETNTKTGAYYFMNYRGSGIDENSVRALCCRLQISTSELAQASGLWNAASGTGSTGVVSLNLGRVGYQINRGGDKYKIIDSLLESARRILLVKRRLIADTFSRGLLPLSKFYGININHYFNTIGIIGLNEYFLNQEKMDNSFGTYTHIPESEKLLDYINARLKQFQEEDRILYNLEQTPGEGSCTRFAALDRKLYPDITTLGTADAPYYSTLLTPPSDNIFWRARMDAESKLLYKFSGGTVFRMYLAREDEPEAVGKLINFISERRIPYFDFSPTMSYCPAEEKRWVGKDEKCPTCGGATEIWSRVVGYVRPTYKWSKGKRAEFEARNYIESW